MGVGSGGVCVGVVCWADEIRMCGGGGDVSEGADQGAYV